MGGRGYVAINIDEEPPDKWAWLKDVETERLHKYIDRSTYLLDAGKADPQKRSIHIVNYYASRELQRRKNEG